MSKVYTDPRHYADIADAIRAKNGLTDTYKPSEMPAAIRAIETGGETEPLSVTANGTYYPPAGVDGFSPVTVRVSGSETPYSDSMRDLLVLWYDGIENAGEGIHDPTATTWTDLSGNGNDGTITDGTWASDHLVFNGSTTWVNCGRQDLPVLTLEVVVMHNSAQSSGESDSVAGNWQSGGYGIQLKDGKYVSQIYLSGWKAVNGDDVELASVKVLTVTFDGTICRFFEDGVETDSLSVRGAVSSPSRSTVLSIGSNPNGSAIGITPLDGNIYSARLYNAGLPPDTVAGLYSEVISRFTDV